MNSCVRFFLPTVFGVQLAVSSSAFAGNLDRLGEVDDIRISPSDGQATLVLVLEERILSEYQKYARSERFLEHHPRANAALPAILLIKVPTPVSTAEMQNLSGIRNQFGKHRVKVAVEQFEPPRNAASGASGT
jgi:hypothetical protein